MASSSQQQPEIDMEKAMETPSRNLPFEPLSVMVAGVQIHKQERIDNDGPRYATWRNNLTALSQYRNLYFIASFDKIHVYKPHFPNQTLDQKPQLILDLPVSRPGLRGTINPRRPHAVNHLVVGCLGDEEILLMACDDGDVLGYNTRNIFAAINRTEVDEDAAQPQNKGKFVRPFFHDNVGKSAWGLAIHKSARMIAVSCNTHEITVFAFALAKKHQNASPDSADMSKFLLSLGGGDWKRLTHMSLHSHFTDPNIVAEFLSRREHNFRLSLHGHYCNIPSIAFYNSDDDKEGRWLVSTDIESLVFLWDVWKMELVGETVMNEKTSDTCGWGVLCLDPRSFKETTGNNDAFGCDPDTLAIRPNVWNISKSKEKLRDYSDDLSSVAMAITGGQGWANNEDEDDDNDEGNEEDDGEEDEDDDENEIFDEDAFLELLEDGLANDVYDIFDEEETEELEGEGLESGEEILEDIDLIGDSGVPDWYYHFQSREATREMPTDQIPYFPIFVSGIEDVGLLESSHLNESCVCHDLLETKVCDQITYHLKQMERINMLLYCTDLNLVVAGSQNGSVCLLTLTWGDDGELQRPAFRIEARLPFFSQEKAGARPKGYLAGIAIGPIQGRELEIEGDETVSGSPMKKKEAWRRVESRRRYRLILYHLDGMILSYELGRDDERGSLLGY